jgi:hypothetical protein
VKSKEFKQAAHVTLMKVTTLWFGFTGRDHLGGPDIIILK